MVFFAKEGLGLYLYRCAATDRHVLVLQSPSSQFTSPVLRLWVWCCTIRRSDSQYRVRSESIAVAPDRVPASGASAPGAYPQSVWSDNSHIPIPPPEAGHD